MNKPKEEQGLHTPHYKEFECLCKSVAVKCRVGPVIAQDPGNKEFIVDVVINDVAYTFVIVDRPKTPTSAAYQTASSFHRSVYMTQYDYYRFHSIVLIPMLHSTDGIPQLFEQAIEQVLHYHLSQVQQQV